MKVKNLKKNKLTIRQSRLLQELPKSDSITEAGERAGYSDRTASNRALKNLGERMPEILEKFGLSPEFVVNKCLLPLLQANETKFFASNGIVLDTREVEALDVRLRAIEIWAKLAGANTAQKVQLNGSIDHHGIDLSEVSDAILQRIVGLAQVGSSGDRASEG